MGIDRALIALDAALAAAGIPTVSVARDRIDYAESATTDQRQQGDAILAAFDWDAEPVPQIVTPLQARRALRQTGRLAAITESLESAGEETREAWEYATEIRRDDPILAGMAASLGMTGEQIDDLFRLAVTLSQNAP